MKVTIKTILMLTAMGVFLVACGNDTHEKTHEHNETNTHAEEHQHEHNDVLLELNDGEKWQTNKEMKPFIDQGELYVEKYISENDNDYKALANHLEEKNNKVVSSCTMTGKSHDVLHKWLQPHMELVKKLKNAKSKEEADRIVQEIKKSFNTYHKYFK